MSKYTYEEKIEAVLRVIDKGMSYEESARILGTGKEVVRRWTACYNQFGPEGLLMKHGTYSGDFKLSVIKYMHDSQLSLLLPKSTFYFYLKQIRQIWIQIFRLYNGKVISYNISLHPDFRQTMDMLDKAFVIILDNSGVIIHSDQGWQYQMKRYQQRLKRKV